MTGVMTTGRMRKKGSSVVRMTMESTIMTDESNRFMRMREYSSLKVMVSRFIVVSSSPML